MFGLHQLPFRDGGLPGFFGFVVHHGRFADGHYPGMELRGGVTVRPVAGQRLRHQVAMAGKTIAGIWECWPDGTPRFGGFRAGDVPDELPRLRSFTGPVLTKDRRPKARPFSEAEQAEIERIAAEMQKDDLSTDGAVALADEALAIYAGAGIEPLRDDADEAETVRERLTSRQDADRAALEKGIAQMESAGVEPVGDYAAAQAELDELFAAACEEHGVAGRGALEDEQVPPKARKLLGRMALTRLLADRDEAHSSRIFRDASDEDVVDALRLSMGSLVAMRDTWVAEAASERAESAEQAAAERREAAKRAREEAAARAAENAAAEPDRATPEPAEPETPVVTGDAFDAMEFAELRELAKAVRDAGDERADEFWLKSTDELRATLRAIEAEPTEESLEIIAAAAKS